MRSSAYPRAVVYCSLKAAAGQKVKNTAFQSESAGGSTTCTKLLDLNKIDLAQ